MTYKIFFPAALLLMFFSCSELKQAEDPEQNQPVETANFDYNPTGSSSESANKANSFFFDVSVNHPTDKRKFNFNLSDNNSKYRYVQSADKTMLVPMDMKNKYSGSIVFSGNKPGEFELTGGYGTPSVIINVDPSTVGYALRDGKLVVEQYEENGVISGYFTGKAEHADDIAVDVNGSFRIKTK